VTVHFWPTRERRQSFAQRRRAVVPLLALVLIACASTTVTLAANPQAEQVLLSHVPEHIAPTCASQEPADSTREAQVSCHPGGNVAEAVYILFDGNNTMNAAFESHQAQFPGATGENCALGPGRGTYKVDGSPAGSLFCDLKDGVAFIEWTDERFAILSIGIGTSATFAPIYNWWASEAGPNNATGNPVPTVAPATPGQPGPATPAPTVGPVPTAQPGGSGPKVPGTPFSQITGASIHQVLFAAGIDPSRHSPVGIADAFRIGTPTIYALIGWDVIEIGATLDVKLFEGNRLMAEQRVEPNHPDPQAPKVDFDGGFAVPFSPEGGFTAGLYTVQLDYDGLPEQVASFNVTETGDGAPLPANLSGGTPGTAPDLGPVPYADPASVLVVTRTSILRRQMGVDADAVFAAAGRVGTFHDLDADLGPLGAGGISVPAGVTVSIVHGLLRQGNYRYLLILGNDDAVAMSHVDLPDSVDFTDLMQGEGIAGDYVVSDDAYTDLDGDALGIPDLAVARIPTSDNAALMLTQLGEVQPKPSTTFSMVNEVRRSLADGPLGVINSISPVTLYYSPPTLTDQVPQTNQSTARFVYILLHGSGSDTTTWSGEIQQWTALDPGNPLSQYALEERGYTDSLSAPEAGAPGAIVNVGACFGAYTLDSARGDTHKTVENSLALKFLASGSRAFIADTHVSISSNSDPGGPLNTRTGFEVMLWQYIKAGQTPIDAFFNAKREMGAVVARQYADGNGDGFADAPLSGDTNYLTVHEMVYMGRP
jgi:hypothetical protein